MRHFQGQVGAWIGIGICFFLLVGTMAARTATEGSLAASAGEQMTTDLYQQAAKIFLPAAFYEQEDESAVSWLLGQMQHVLPVYAYMGERRQTAGTLESSLGYYEVLAKEASDEAYIDEDGNLISAVEKSIEENEANRITINREKLMDYDYLVQNFYRIDRTTTISSDQLNAAELLAKDLTINTDAGGPVILIYHTHSQEAFADSVDGDTSTTIMGIGTYLTELLNARGIETLHHEGIYDLIDGKLDRSRAYQLAEPDVRQILKDNPSIEVVIDLHRDGVAQGTHLVTEINGKPTAQIMFFNGLSRTRKNGEIAYLNNPYREDNLATSFQMQLMAARYYPGFTRHIYLKSYRYNLDLAPKAMLIEAGAQTNTVEEMRNAMEVLADVLSRVLTP